MAPDRQPANAGSKANDNVVTGRFTPAALTTGIEPRIDPQPDSPAEYLEAAIGLGYRPLPSQSRTHTDAYFDTEAFDILRSGFTLRLRGTESGVEVTLNSLDRPGFDDLDAQRLEAGGPVANRAAPMDPAGWPDAVRDRVRAAVGGSPRWLPICVLHQRRETIPLAAGDEDEAFPVVAELNVDVVSVFDPGEPEGDGSMDCVTRLLEDGTPCATFTELSVEPTEEGSRYVLPDLHGWLQAMPDLAPAAGGKLEQALAVLADHPAGAAPGDLGVAPGLTMTEAGRLMWRRQLLAMLLNEAGARRGEDIEYVHDMRVATRRARAVARLFGPFLHDKTVRDRLRYLRRTSRALGAVRDLDVALQNLRKHAQSRPAAEQPGLGEIRAVWRVERRDAYRRLQSWLDSPDYRSFIAGFARLCRSAGAGASQASSKREGGPKPTDVGHVMPSAILNRFEQVRAYETLFASAVPVDVAALHALRIDCKALRYSLEPVEPLLGEEGAAIIGKLKRLQDLLGDLNDADVADRRLAALTGVVEPEPLAIYRDHQQAVLADRAAAAPAALFAFVAPDTRRTLAIAISKL